MPIWELSANGTLSHAIPTEYQLNPSSAIRISWLCFAYPCLLLAYIGQAAYISRDPSAYSNPFFNTVPPHMFYPSLVISILAAIVASQALITSTFQLLSQIMHSSYFPHIKMVYTSNEFYGQIYIPLANWLMMIGTVIVTAVYNNVRYSCHHTQRKLGEEQRLIRYAYRQPNSVTRTECVSS